MSDLAVGALTRADGLQLIGEMRGSGYRNPPALVRRADRQTLQLTPLLYAVLAAVDGRRTPEQIAAIATETTGKPVSAANVEHLADTQLRPLGLLTTPDGRQPELKRSNPLLGLRWKVAVTDPDRTRRLTAPFSALFHPVIWIPAVVAFVVIAGWVLFVKGLGSATYQAFQEPGLLLLVFALTVLSAGFHEFGHAAAARRGGATPGVMGAGLYLVWPAFYTDVTDSYRLGRAGRVRTDLGGLYFNALVAVGVFGLWWATRWDAWLLLVATQVIQMIRQLAPLVRFDGYHILADLTGVPDLFQRIKPTLLSLLPHRWRSPEARVLKPWARFVVTAWVLVVVPLLLAMVVLLVLALPRLLGTAWASAGAHLAAANAALGQGRSVDAAGGYLLVAAVTFTMLAILLMLGRLARQLVAATLRRTTGRPVQRVLAGVLGLALIAGLAAAWWPDQQRYRPVQPWESGTVSAGLSTPLARAGLVAPADPASDLTGGTVRTVWPEGQPLPTADEPAFAMVMRPRTDGGLTVGDARTPTSDASAPTWVFPFAEPEPPRPGDQQAKAVNTTDNTMLYDVAFAMVWADGSQPVDTSNEAYAFASCSDCVSVAIAFQVVFVVGEADVVVPRNIAAAANYNCYSCITAAIASQLVITLAEPVDGADQVALAAVWSDLFAWASTVTDYSVAEIQGYLDQVKAEIVAIVTDGAGTLPGATEPTPSPGASPDGADASLGADPSDAPSDQPTDQPTTDPSDQPTSDPSDAGTSEPAAPAETSATPDGTPEPSPSP